MTIGWIAVIGALVFICAATAWLSYLMRRRAREAGDPMLRALRDERTMVMLKAHARSPGKGF